jgi:enoyl-CoA hydratase/carnithine racemase
MNSINPPTSQEMDAALNEFDADPEAWVCIITGAGDKAFSAGNDLKYWSEHGAQKAGEEFAKCRGGFGGITARFDCYKPVIAAVNGLAMGGGFEIVLSCDIIIAAESAVFSLPEPRVGLIPGAGGVHRLPRQIPYHLAMGMIMTSKRVSAEEAKAYGIVNEVVPFDKLGETAQAYVDEILKGAPLCIRACKEATLKGYDMPLDKAMASVFPEEEKMRKSEDTVEGPRAFAEKRAPQWKGR